MVFVKRFTFLSLYRTISGIFYHNHRNNKLKKRKENILDKYGCKIVGPGGVSYAGNKVELDLNYRKFSIGVNARVTEGLDYINNFKLLL